MFSSRFNVGELDGGSASNIFLCMASGEERDKNIVSGVEVGARQQRVLLAWRLHVNSVGALAEYSALTIICRGSAKSREDTSRDKTKRRRLHR